MSILFLIFLDLGKFFSLNPDKIEVKRKAETLERYLSTKKAKSSDFSELLLNHHLFMHVKLI
jgi:hypothetical protein